MTLLQKRLLFITNGSSENTNTRTEHHSQSDSPVARERPGLRLWGFPLTPGLQVTSGKGKETTKIPKYRKYRKVTITLGLLTLTAAHPSL